MEETEGVRYPIGGPVAYQLNSLDSLLKRGSILFRYAAILLTLFAIVLMSMFVSNSIRQRKREVGILRALGATDLDVVTIFLSERFLIAFINVVLTSSSVLLTSLIGNAILQNNLDLILTLFNFGLRQVGIIFGLSFGIATVSSLIPILRIARQKPVDAIRE
jgi:ABC-type antimicrobial peptide transport system permease subunit